MINFFVGILLWSVVLGISIGLMLTVDVKGMKRIFFTIIIALVIGTIVSAGFQMEYNGDKSQWNNGNCPNCNIEWELVSVQHLRNSGEVYYWSCPQCGTIIELHRQF